MAIQSLNGKSVLITGASRGIGRAIAIGLAEVGANLSLIARDTHKLSELVETVNRMGTCRAVYTATGVENDQGMRAAFQQAKDEFGRIDVVIANAGANFEPGNVPAFEDTSIEEWQRIFAVNVFGVATTCKLAVEFFGNQGGRIITMGSGMGHLGAAGNIPYAASKAAGWLVTKSLAQALKSKNIHVNEIIPGGVITDMNPHDAGLDSKQPDELVPLVVYLASQTDNGPTGQSFSLMRR